MEFAHELADIYGDLYEEEVSKAKKSGTQIRNFASKAIENARFFTQAIYSKEDLEDKFDYFSAVLNLEFIVVDKLTKWYTKDGRERIDKTKEALDEYRKMARFIDEYKKFKGLKEDADIEKKQTRE
jgi:hypothetical protein